MTVFWIDGVSPGRLAIGPCPSQIELMELRLEGVDAVVSLLEDRDDEAERCKTLDVAFLWLPIHDGGVPGPGADDLVRKIAGYTRTGESVFIHCLGGIGRSGTIASAVLVELGAPPTEAIARVSSARGLTVPENPDQRDWIHAYARRGR